MQRVALRLHHGGAFKKDPETGECRYVGGSVFNDAVPSTVKYHELCLRVNQKVGEPVSIKYQAPGEDLDVEALVSVTDDDDLQELKNEYFDALQRLGSQTTRTFRIQVFLQPALQFEIEQGDPALDAAAHADSFLLSEDDMSLNCQDYCSEPFSYDPSSDTECQMAQAAGPASAAFAQAQLYTAAASQMAGLQMAHPQAEGSAAANGTGWRHPLEDHALTNLSRSLQAYPLLNGSRVAASPIPAFTADDFRVDDPYQEDPDGSAAPSPPQKQQAAADRALATAMQVSPSPAIPIAASLYNRPLDRVRDAVSGLPSHISAFGDGGTATSGADRLGTSLKLPSHISAFGEESEPPQASAADNLPELSVPGTLWRASHCITQEFGEKSQSGGGQGSQGAANDKPTGEGGPGLTETQSCPTPKAFLQTVHNVTRSQVQQCTKIGEGAFGEVSCAEVFPFGTVAIKWLKKDRFAKYSESFQREAEVLARLNHPNIIRMFGLITEPTSSPPASVAAGGGPGPMAQDTPAASGGSQRGGDPLIAGIMMEYLDGGSLAQRLRGLAVQGRRLSLKEMTRVALQASLGMAYLHEQNPAVIHFDLKPDNLLLQGEGDNVLVKVADFGLSKHKIQSYVTCHDLRGTLPYMAPELVRCPNQVCEKCDVWSMGVVMWEMVTLEIPFQDLTAQDILRGLMQGNLHLRMPATLDPDWRQLIHACMEPEPAVRPTFRQLAARLEELNKKIQLSAQQQQQQQEQLLQAQQVAQAVAVAQQQQQAAQAQQQQQQLYAAAAAQQKAAAVQQAFQPAPLALAPVQALLYAHHAQLQAQQQQQSVPMQVQVQGLYGVTDPTSSAAAALAMGHVGPDVLSQLYAPPRVLTIQPPLMQPGPYPLHH